MKNIFLIALFALFCSISSAQRLTYEDPYQISKNELNASTVFTTYRNLQAALDNESAKSENYTSLDGEWKVKFFDSEKQITDKDFERMNPLMGWRGITLPLAWQMNGHGDAVYSDNAYPFLKEVPKVITIPESGGALYARDFTVPFDYMDKVLYITIGGASSKVTLYINGIEVGFSTDSRNPAQFQITKFVERGLNRIVLKVDQYSGGSWVENQTGWRLSGLNRGIYMLAQPKIRVRDYLVRTTLDPTYSNGLLETALLLKSELLNPHMVTVYYDLYDRRGKLVNQASRDVQIGMRGEDTVRFTATIMNVDKWTAENPSLYTLIYRVKREGRFTEYIARKVGFRNVEIRDKKFLINGFAVQFRGVNLEEYDPKTGNTLTEQTVLGELYKMKQLGINAIRTGGYPLPSFFYEMADSIGFYVVSTANIDASGLANTLRKGGSLSNDPQWKNVFVDRAIATYERGKNNPSIVAWALGESAGNGYNMYKAYEAIKERDTLRAVIYDGAGAEWNTDVVCPLYPSVDALRKLRVEQPIIASRVEFDPKYWKLETTQGAFIDHWRTPSIDVSGVNYVFLSNYYKRNKESNGQVKLSSAEAHIKEIGQLFAPFRVERVSNKSDMVRITNLMQTGNLNFFTISHSNKSLFGKGGWVTLPELDCKAGESVEVKIPGKDVVLKIGNIFTVTL